MITLDDVRAGYLREDGHLNYGRDGFGYAMQHSAIPRLSCIDRYFKGAALKKSGIASARLWCVDGIQVGEGAIEEALARLTEPAIFTADETRFLALAPSDWTELRAFCREHDAEFRGDERPLTIAIMLRRKGALEMERREAEKASFIRRTPAEVRS